MLLERWNSLTQAARHDAIHAALSDTPGVKLNGSHRGTYQVGKRRATLIRHTVADLRLTCPAEMPVSPLAALEMNYQFPGNLRYARVGDQLSLLANILTQPHDQLAENLAEIGQAIATNKVEGAGAVPQDDHPFTTRQLADLLAPLGWEAQAIVELTVGWELRPSVGNRPLAVKLTIESGTLRLGQIVVARPSHAAAAPALYDQALRLNRQLRHARVALAAGQLVVQARLRRGQLCGPALDGAARAVAHAARHARGVLEILNSHPDVAARYAAMFG